jgi:hypothetical protein
MGTSTSRAFKIDAGLKDQNDDAVENPESLIS